MKEQLIEFETAKLAKEKGFDIKTKNSFANKKAISYNQYARDDIREEGEFHVVNKPEESGVDGTYLHNKFVSERFYQPTQSLLQKWLREEHDMHIEIELVDNSRTYQWEYVIITSKDRDYNDEECFDSAKRLFNNEDFETYEEALEKGLQEALKLIK